MFLVRFNSCSASHHICSIVRVYSKKQGILMAMEVSSRCYSTLQHPLLHSADAPLSFSLQICRYHC
eukprot:c18088_g2_i1 orf=3-197(-)